MSDNSDQECAKEKSKKEYDTLLRCRDIDVGLYSTRFNLNLVVQGAVLAFATVQLLDVKADSSWADKVVPLFITALGLALAIGGRQLLRGASFWVGYWEWRLEEAERNVYPSIRVFSHHPSTRNQAALKALPNHLKYVSTQSTVIWLQNVFVVLWLLVGTYIVFR